MTDKAINHLKPAAEVGFREIKLVSQESTRLPHLSGLCAELGLVVLQSLDHGSQSPRFQLATSDYLQRQNASVTPPLLSLDKLELYAEKSRHRIYNNYIYGVIECELIDVNAQLGNLA